MTNTISIDGYNAVIQYDPEIEMFRGEFVDLNGGADFYAQDVEGLKREARESLAVFFEMCREEGVQSLAPNTLRDSATSSYDPTTNRSVSQPRNAFPSICLFLIRHAQARNAEGACYDDAPLSAVGRAQGDAAAGAIAARRPGALYASPARRARQTADLIAEATGLAVAVDERLREFVFGSISEPGLTLEQQRERRDDLLAWRPDHRLAPDSDTPREFALRVAAALDRIVARHVGERVAVVAHAGTIDVAINWAMGVGPNTPVMHDFPIANASITELIHWPRGRIAGGSPRYTDFVSVGSLAHLPPASRSDN